MTKLPPHLEVECERLAEVYAANYVAENNECFETTYAEHWGRVDHATTYRSGFHAAYALLIEDMRKMEDALESAECAIAIFGVTAYGQYNPKCSSLLEVKKALKEFQSKYGETK